MVLTGAGERFCVGADLAAGGGKGFGGGRADAVGVLHADDRRDGLGLGQVRGRGVGDAQVPDQPGIAQAGQRAEMLGDKKVSEDDKRRIYIARIMWEKMGEGKERDDRLQIAPNSQQFVGDPFENRKIKQTFGTHRNMRAALMNATATRH